MPHDSREAPLPGDSEQTVTIHRERDEYAHRSARMVVKEYTLVVLKGPHKRLKLPFDRDMLVIGRQEELCDLVLDQDAQVSGRHARLTVTEEGVRLQDLNSRNGCFLSGHRVFDAMLEPGDKFQIGHTVMSLRASKNQTTSLEIHFCDESGLLVGQSKDMRQIFSVLQRLRGRDIPVFLTGETGTGKTSIARALHRQSHVSSGPFVSVNCGALSPSLIESLLFGHEKGAFTGADKLHKGFFEQAHKGTLFLDEIGEMPLEIQPKLLDVLESQRFKRLGGSKELHVQFRLVAATHRDLFQDVQDGRFREDLFYRISVITLEVPPLRERLEDLPLLSEMLLEKLSPGYPMTLTPEAQQKLQKYVWPGNVRQLRNVLQRALAFAEGEKIQAADLEFPQLPGEAPGAAPQLPAIEVGEDALQIPVSWGSEESSLKALMAHTEKTIVETALLRTDWNVPQAALLLGISQSWIYKRIDKYSLKRPD